MKGDELGGARGTHDRYVKYISLIRETWRDENFWTWLYGLVWTFDASQVRHITIRHNGFSSKESSPLLLITNFTPSPHNTFDPRELLCALNTFRKQWRQTKRTLKLKLWKRHKAPGDQSFYTNFLLAFPNNELWGFKVTELIRDNPVCLNDQVINELISKSL